MALVEGPQAAKACYRCIHRRALVGSCHSACHHPTTADVHADPTMHLVALLGKRSGVAFINCPAATALQIAGVMHGLRHGWFIWPINFDPVWLTRCAGFEPRPWVPPAAEDPTP